MTTVIHLELPPGKLVLLAEALHMRTIPIEVTPQELEIVIALVDSERNQVATEAVTVIAHFDDVIASLRAKRPKPIPVDDPPF